MQKEDRTTPKKRKSTSSRAAFPFNEVSRWPYLDDKETVTLELERHSCDFFMNGWKGARPGRLGICCIKKKMFFEKYTLLIDTSFFCVFLNFYFLLPSQTWMLGFSLGRLQKILCLVFLFVCCVPYFLFMRIYFSKACLIFSFFLFQNLPILEFACWDSFESSSLPLFCYCFYFFLFIAEVTALCSKFSFIKGEPAQLRFHSSEFSVSICILLCCCKDLGEQTMRTLCCCPCLKYVEQWRLET